MPPLCGWPSPAARARRPRRAALVAALAALGVHRGRRPPWDADVDWSAYDLVVIRSTWDYVARRDEFLAWGMSNTWTCMPRRLAGSNPGMLEVQINPGDAGLLNQALDLAIALFRRAARNRDDHDDLTIQVDDVALRELGFLVDRGEASPFNDARIRKALEHPPNLGGFRLKPSHVTAPHARVGP